jgi:hypothetical protein
MHFVIPSSAYSRSSTPLTNTAVLKATGKTVVIQNAWIFEAANGRLVNAQLDADTAAVRPSAA